jgi:ferritin-like metal-binding protein YciE
MALFSKDIQTMDDLFLHALQDIYYAEKKIESTLPKMIQKAGAGPLRDGFESHLDETHGHVERLEQAFTWLDKTPTVVSCPAIDGIIREADEIAHDISDQSVMDAALAAAAQAVEHYEITRYGTLIAWAREMDRNDLVELFEATLKEEKAADSRLTELAEARLNATA